jgi:ferredoxin--NADP+ reductase
MPVNIAIVGAGPAGFYTAEALLSGDNNVRIDFIERLPTPYGLIRAGVAPDHQTTKKAARKFEKTALREPVSYYGNVEVGRDVGLSELRQMYDAVVLAIGAPDDQYLGIPGEELRGVYGSALIVGWYNGHPDFCGLDPDLDTTAAVVVGNGNVALDVARVLTKTPEEMAASDIADYAAETIRRSPIRDVYLLGRRGPLEAKFTNVELREMGRLAECMPVVDAGDLPDSIGGDRDDRDARVKERNLATLRELATLGTVEKPRRVHFVFFASPTEILGQGRVEALRYERTRLAGERAVGTGEFHTIRCGLIVSAIGYRSAPLPGIPYDATRGRILNIDGRVEKGLYAVGWAKRGPSGVISSNRPDGVRCAEQIRMDLADGSKPGREALETLLAERKIRAIGFDEWRRIDAAEVSQAAGPAPRRKFTTLAEFLGVLDR